MIKTAVVLVALPVGCLIYAYAGYPLALWLLAGLGRRDRNRPAGRSDRGAWQWPSVSICLPAHNEATTIASTMEALLGLDYPSERLQILVVSDASTDGTDEIVRSYAARGVELLRLPERGGKTAAENTAAPKLTGDIVVNTDATTRILPGSLKPLIQAFGDPSVGVASGRDQSAVGAHAGSNEGESGYVEYEMWVRSLETKLGSIVGASGCFYAMRRELHCTPVPEHLSRDFASALTAQDAGLRAVSVNDAICLVPRTGSLQRELRRKTRTMARGLDTLWYKRHLLNPLRYGRFSVMLFSHKLCRWLVSLTAPVGLLGMLILALDISPALSVGLLGLALGGIGIGVLGLRWPEDRPAPRTIAAPAYVFAGGLAGLLAWWLFARRHQGAIWEPTRRLPEE